MEFLCDFFISEQYLQLRLHIVPLILSIKELQKAVGECAEQEHICGVARNHFLQLIGDCPKQLKKEMLRLFIRKYSLYAEVENYLYISAFKNAYRENITSNSAYLYISKYDTLSKMSNFVSIS